MKRASFAVLLLLASCHSNKQVAVCTQQNIGLYSDTTETIEAVNNIVQTIVFEGNIETETTEAADDLMNRGEKLLEEIEDIAGITVSIKRVNDTTIQDYVIFDFRVADRQTLIEYRMIEPDSDEASFEEIVAFFEEYGSDCKIK